MLEVKGLSIGYDNQIVAKDLNFQIREGDYVCIIGENGVGKSTLVKTLLHLQKPLAGEINLKTKGIGYLPQQSIIQRDFPASVWEIVLSGNLLLLGMKPFYSKQEKLRAKKQMEKLGIWNLRKKSYRNLSGGQQQRVLLARALCASSNILFLDEPVTGLDPKASADFYKLVKELNQEGITIIMVSHDLPAVLKYSTHILHIQKDHIFYGETKEYSLSLNWEGVGV